MNLKNQIADLEYRFTAKYSAEQLKALYKDSGITGPGPATFEKLGALANFSLTKVLPLPPPAATPPPAKVPAAAAVRREPLTLHQVNRIGHAVGLGGNAKTLDEAHIDFYAANLEIPGMNMSLLAELVPKRQANVGLARSLRASRQQTVNKLVAEELKRNS